MISSFKDDEPRHLFLTGRSRKFGNVARVAVRRLGLLEFAISLEDLRDPPGNRLEKLKGNRAGQYSLRINDKFRVCFRWQEGKASDVEIVDYH